MAKRKDRPAADQRGVAVPEATEAEQPTGPEVHPLFRKARYEQIDRAAIKLAAYNPRTLTSDAQVKLSNGLHKFGMVEPLVYNELTGNLVGGHQRIAELDRIHGSSDGYSLWVSVVRLSETREKELNILLNNEGAQGGWDFQKLAEMIASDQKIDADLMGFDKVWLNGALNAFAKLDGLDLTHVFGKPEEDDAGADAEQIKAMKATKKEFREQQGEAAKDGFYLQLVFKTPDQKERFCKAAGVNPANKVALGVPVAERLGIDVTAGEVVNAQDEAEAQEAGDAGERPEA